MKITTHTYKSQLTTNLLKIQTKQTLSKNKNYLGKIIKIKNKWPPFIYKSNKTAKKERKKKENITCPNWSRFDRTMKPSNEPWNPLPEPLGSRRCSNRNEAWELERNKKETKSVNFLFEKRHFFDHEPVTLI